MAEPRRVELKTISVPNGEKKAQNRPLTQRFTLALGESTATTCPEFSFTELTKKEKKASGSASGINPDDPFGEEDDHDEVAALARKFEEKYGPKPKKRKKLKCLEDEYYDLGEGYDENDPFIDNTEAYDEVVPSCLTTQHGGFYINRGTLDFRTLSDQEDSAAEFTPTAKKRGRPRKILDSDSEQEGGEPKKKRIKKKKLKEGLVEGEKKKKKKVSFGADGEKIKQKKTIDPDKKKKNTATVAELLKQQTVSTAATPNGSFDEFRPGAPQNSDLPSERSTIQDRIDSVITEQLTEGQSDEKKQNGGGGGGEGPNNLPTDLPIQLSQAIDNIKQAAKATTEGKCKFFSGDVNRMLLDIELGSRQLTSSKRSSIYNHLADHLPCGKETLVKRAKKLRENQQDDQLKKPIQRLKEAISEVMPSLIEQHEQEVLKYKMENKEKPDEGGDAKEEGANTESDDEEKPTVDGQSRKGNRGPRKKFKWAKEIRELLCQIVSIKMQMYETYRIRNQTAEEYLKTFLNNEVKPLWPQGWIQTRMLFKESRAVHGSWTNPVKPKKPLLVTKSTGSPQPREPASVSPENVPDSKQTKTPTGPFSMFNEVIELSDNEDKPTPVAARESKGSGTPSFSLKGSGTSSVSMGPAPLGPSVEGPKGGGPMDPLDISTNSAAAIAAAAVSTPKMQPQGVDKRLRDNLVTEILKGMKPNTLGITMPGRNPPVASTPTTPPTPQTPQGKESMNSPFLAEFDRYLNSRQSSTQAGSTTATQRQQMSAQQVQSKTVSSSTGKAEMVSDAKSKQPAQIKWQMDGLLGEDKARRMSGGSQQMSGSVDTSPAQQAGYRKMFSLLSEPATSGQKSKGDQVRDEILSKIQAEIARASLPPGMSGDDHSKKTAGSSVSPQAAKQAGYPQAGRQTKPSFPATAHSGTTQRHSSPGGGGNIPAAHQQHSSGYPQAAGAMRQTSLMPGAERGGNVRQAGGSTSVSPPSASFQRNTSGQVTTKDSLGQQRTSGIVRHPSYSQGYTPPHPQKNPTTTNSMDGAHKMTPTSSPSGPQFSNKKLAGSGSNNVSPSSGGAPRAMEKTLFEQIENQFKEQAAMEQAAQRNMARAGLPIPPRGSPSSSRQPSQWAAQGRTQVASNSMAGAQSGGKAVGTPLPAHAGAASSPQGQLSPRQPPGLYNPRLGSLPAYTSLHSHTGPLYKDNSKPAH